MWLKIVWQTGATSEHHVQRRVHTYRNYIDIDRLRQRIVDLNAEHKMDAEIAAILNQLSNGAAGPQRFWDLKLAVGGHLRPSIVATSRLQPALGNCCRPGNFGVPQTG